MLIGSYYYSLEDKGRLAIPKQFRLTLKSRPIITRGLDGCLFLLPPKTWQQLTSELSSSPLTTKDSRDFHRLIAHGASPVAYDQQGRILIPQFLRQYAGLKKQVVIAGSVRWIEIWDQARYHQHMNKIEKSGEVIAERLTTSG
jgi:MraZ protein